MCDPICRSGDVELICALSVSVKGRLDVNVALNRPSYQKSTYHIYHADLGNDGKSGTDVNIGQCSLTDSTAHPWWSVDLGVALNVAGVKYTSGNSYGEFV